MKAAWIALEGGDGSGKSTQARLLAERLEAVLTREPGGTAVGERVRSILLDAGLAGLDDRAEALLMAADRAQHVSEVVRPALDAGRSVVSDRSAFSSLAYQGYGRGLGVDDVRRLCAWATGDLWPDLVVLLRVGTDEREGRMQEPPDRLESAGADFHHRVVAGFEALAREDPARWVVVDGAGAVSDVAHRVATAVAGWEAGRG